jgi:hypothetical protein
MSASAPAGTALPDGRAARRTLTEGAARAGLVARGAIYLLVGALALRIAFGDGGRQADRSGALAELSGRPFGSVLLWALGLGLAGMAVWRLSETVFGAAGPEGRTWRRRLGAFCGCVFYAVMSYSVLAFAAGEGGGGSTSSDEQSKDVTARVLELPGGRWLVAAAGLGVIVAGVWILVRAVLRRHRDDLRSGEIPRLVRPAVDTAAVAGGVARGLVFAVAGGFAVRAAMVHEPDEAKGLDDTLRSFADAPLGPFLLTCVAAGLVLFGLFSFAAARWGRF